MFILVHQDLVVEEKVDIVTNCEIEWVQIKLAGNKALLVSSFYCLIGICLTSQS